MPMAGGGGLGVVSLQLPSASPNLLHLARADEGSYRQLCLKEGMAAHYWFLIKGKKLRP